MTRPKALYNTLNYDLCQRICIVFATSEKHSANTRHSSEVRNVFFWGHQNMLTMAWIGCFFLKVNDKVVCTDIAA